MYLGSVVDTLAVCWCNKLSFLPNLWRLFFTCQRPHFAFKRWAWPVNCQALCKEKAAITAVLQTCLEKAAFVGLVKGTCRDLSGILVGFWDIRHSCTKKCHIESESVPLGEVNGQLERGEEICQKVTCFRTVLESRMPCFARGCQGQIWKGAFWQAYPWWSVCDPVTFLMGAIETEHNIEMRGLYPRVMLRNHDKK